MKVRILRIMGAHAEVEHSSRQARLYPRESIAYFPYCG